MEFGQLGENDPDLCTPTVQEHRYSISFGVQVVDVRKYADWFSELNPPFDEEFRRNYGCLDSLLKVEVIPTALKTLAQFFDPDWKCFAFPSFFLGPTIEECESILEMPVEGRMPYLFRGDLPDERLVGIIEGLASGDNRRILTTHSGTIGISEKYLEERLTVLAGQQNWKDFSTVLALAIFGLVLLPEKPGWISHRAIDVFVGFKIRKENPVPAILSDIYGNMFRLHTRTGKNKKMRCCLPLLYAWLIYRLFLKPSMFGSIMDTFFAIQSQGLTEMDWPQLLRGSSHPHIRWQTRKPEFEKFIYRCGEFYNVPLMGTLGCYAYNPLLFQRQLGFDLVGRPEVGRFRRFEFHFDKEYDPRDVRRVCQAWREISWIKAIPGCMNAKMDEEYSLWVERQIFRIGLPFSSQNDWRVYKRPMLMRPFKDDLGTEKSEKEASARLDDYLKKKKKKKK